MTSESRSILLIGAILGEGGAVSALWREAIGRLSVEAEALGAGMRSEVNVNVVFHVDGRHQRNEFEGVRTGSFFRSINTLEVQAALAGGEVESRREVLLNSLLAAVEEAERYVRRRKLADGLPEIRGVVEELQAS